MKSEMAADFASSQLADVIGKYVEENVLFGECIHITGTLFVTVDNHKTFDLSVCKDIRKAGSLQNSINIRCNSQDFFKKNREGLQNEVIKDDDNNMDFDATIENKGASPLILRHDGKSCW